VLPSICVGPATSFPTDPAHQRSTDGADRAEVVRQTLLAAGIDAPEIERMAASVTLPDGSPRFVWTDSRPGRDSYVTVILQSITERLRWRAQYEAAKATAAAGTEAVDGVSTVGQPP
jgi:hypothetical protein